MGVAAGVSTRWTRISRRAMPPSTSRRAGRSKTSARHSRYVSTRIGKLPYRECLADVFDLPALREVLGGIARREIRVHRVETPAATPMASSLLFDYVAAYMYEGDAPLAERLRAALALDRDLLRELLGQEELRELLDPAALDETELGLQALRDDRKAGSVDQVADLLRRLGDLAEQEVAARTRGGPAAARPGSDLVLGQ